MASTQKENLPPSNGTTAGAAKSKSVRPVSKQAGSKSATAEKAATPAAKTSGGRSITKQALQDKTVELEDENARLRVKTHGVQAQLQQARDAQKTAEQAAEDADTARKAAEEKAKNVSNNNGDPTVLVPKPPPNELNQGDRGRLMRAMKLEEDKAQYLAIQATVHDLVSRVGMDLSVQYIKQPPSLLGKLFKRARRTHKYLERFENDWPTAELAKQYLQNIRKHRNRKRKGTVTRNGGHSTGRSRFGDDDDDDDEEDENIQDRDDEGLGGRGSEGADGAASDRDSD
ncbi:hypothetical protein BJ138DRAFT_1106148 [Hygrophoropsis aurantiaca]|uniref:Uncharacterized protein n=1 Tax=Hygrophoropsis aurantiaca TaxID=72124 RepID=A0ACB7ZX43_9AGAM|nr:hypothetical protein BJ138DRAFT_1106148 [Hygrophoropsis aurantiaca]